MNRLAVSSRTIRQCSSFLVPRRLAGVAGSTRSPLRTARIRSTSPNPPTMKQYLCFKPTRVGPKLLMLAALFGVVPNLAVPGATLTVTSTADSGPGSLRERVAAAASGDTIVFAVNNTITLTSGEIILSAALNILGPGANVLAVSGN